MNRVSDHRAGQFYNSTIGVNEINIINNLVAIRVYIYITIVKNCNARVIMHRYRWPALSQFFDINPPVTRTAAGRSIRCVIPVDRAAISRNKRDFNLKNVSGSAPNCKWNRGYSQPSTDWQVFRDIPVG